MQYQVYWHLPSSQDHLSVDDADATDSLDVLRDLVPRLESAEDEVSVYLPESTFRLQIWLTEGGDYAVQLDDPNQAGTVSKTINGGDVDAVIEAANQITANPHTTGWRFEHW